jgi:RHS repeat-associated protein
MKSIQNRVSFATAEAQALTHLRAGQKVGQAFRCGAAAITCHLRKSVCIALILSLLATSTPAAPQTIVRFAEETSVDLAFWLHSSGWRKAAAELLQGQNSNGKGQEKQRDRDARVARIQILPGDVTVDLNDHIRFAAVAYDRDNTPVGGVKIKWSGRDADNGRRARISQHGEFEATAPGTFNIVAEGAGQSAAVTVVVRPGIRRNPNAAPTGTRQVSTRNLPSAVATKTDRVSESVAQRSSKSATTKKRRGSLLRGHALRSKSAPVVSPSFTPPPTPFLPGEGWDGTNFESADDPENRVGDPPGGAMDEGAGSGNFQLAAPVLGLPGRGIDIPLGLAYNSRLWNKAQSQISFDLDRGWPAPGWSLGFGKILGMGVFNGGMIVDADGTRHGFSGVITEFPWGTTFVGHTTDGTFIDYSYTSGTGGGIVHAEAKLANGTVINYGAPGPGAVYPTSIKDPNGNYITITYVNNSGPRIQTVVDTLNRPINFHYDANNFLTAITGPGLNGGTRTLLRVNYRQISLNYSFNGLNPVVRDPSPWVVNAIYYPGTNTGYWFGDADSYSSYGMLTKVSERREMSFSAASLNDQGSVTSAGLVTREELYSYPLTTSDPGGSGLTDAPTYPSMTERWSRDGINIDEAVTSYSAQPNASPRTITITLPNGTKSVQYSHNLPGNFQDGLVYQDQTLDSNNNVLQSSSVTWAQGAYESPRPTRVEATNELSQMTATEFSYGSVFNQVTEVRNYDYGGATLLRATRTQYQNSANYTSRHIFSLPLVVEVFASDEVTRVSRTDYQYDGQTLTARPDVVQHDLAFNPHAAAEGHCFWENDWSDPDCHGACIPELIGCDGHCPQIFHCPYNPATDYRGNVTQVTSYADAVNLTNPVTETKRYDITGNLVTASSSCCEQTTFNYTVDTQYAYPLSETRGSATDPLKQLNSNAAYDFNTGLVLSKTDANGRASQTSYLAETLRPQTSTLPSGAHTDYAYDEAGMSVTETTFLESHPTDTTIANQNVKLFNGRGQMRQEKALGAGSVWDIVDVIYDSMGRVSQQTRPYRNGETPQWSANTYDSLSRVVSVQAPDGSTTQTFYNEIARPPLASSTPGETTRVRDAWGRERWGRADAQGRLVEVAEPNPLGSGSVFEAGALLTTYEYNTLGNLTQTNQSGQTRSFKYDSLGHLTAQRLAEMNATLNDAGQYVGSGTWSDVFTYDARSNLTTRTDARGVKTIYSYNDDPLNRLQSVAWDTSGFGDTSNPILPAATVTYQYRTKSSGPQLLDITQLNSITTTGVSTETYGYDAEGRVSIKTLTLTSRPSHPFVTDYTYDKLDRIEDLRYPAEYGNGTQPRKLVHHTYDVASRLTTLSVDGTIHASNIVYNAASQTTSIGVGAGGPNQILESYNYDQQTGLLTSQTLARSSAPTNWLLNLSYDYAGTNGKRTGQLVKILNNLNHNKDRSYSYDALGRLVQAKGGAASTPLWTQTYSYDSFGNRTSVSASGFSAKLNPHDNRQLAMADAGNAGAPPATASASDHQSAIGNPQPAMGKSHHASRSARTNMATPQGGPPIFTDDPLVPGVTLIKAVHINELRTAVNQARAHASLPAATWAETVSVGGLIKAQHIVELRARLDEARAALGLPVASYTDPSLSAGIIVKAVHIQQLRQRVTEAVTSSLAIAVDGHANLSYDLMNRITTTGFAYEKAGNQVRALAAGGGSQRFQYDAANRLVKVKADDNVTVLASYTYGDSNERLILEEAGVRTYYACDGIVEYTESGSSITPQWSKSYVYFGARLLSTLTPNGSGGAFVQYHHPDRLGTRVVTNAQDTGYFEQVSLPFGTALNAESTGATNRRFTTYDRSSTTGLDYALNRHYDSQQGRFTQIDPIGMASTNLANPQTLNLYVYCTNDPVNHVDPSGLGFFSFLKKVFKGILKILKNKWVQIAIAVAILLIAHFYPHSIFGLGGTSASQAGSAPVLQAAATGPAAATARAAAIAATNAAYAAGGVAALEGAVAASGIASAVSLSLVAAQAAGVATNLSTKAQQKFDKAKEKINKKLQDSFKCRSFLLMSGLSPESVSNALNLQQPFDALRSTLTMARAGLLPGTSAYGSIAVNTFFTNNRFYKAITAVYAGNSVIDRSPVYYTGGGLKGSTILHEVLHSLTGLSDSDLAARLGVTVTSSNTSAISKILKKNDCT